MKLVVDRGYNLETRNEALEVFKHLRKELSDKGNSVVDSTPEEWSNIGDFLYKTAISANNMKGDLFLSLKIEKGEQRRCVVYLKDEKTFNSKVMKELEKNGFETVIIPTIENLYLFKNIKYSSVIMSFTIIENEDTEAISKTILDAILCG